jgi:hypothetical protein
MIVSFLVGRLVVGSGRCGRGLDVGVATATSAAVAEVTGGTGDQRREQVLGLVAGQRGQPGRRRVAGPFSTGLVHPSTASGPPRCSTTYARTSSQTPSWSRTARPGGMGRGGRGRRAGRRPAGSRPGGDPAPADRGPRGQATARPRAAGRPAVHQGRASTLAVALAPTLTALPMMTSW